MKPYERRLRALEALANVKPLQTVPRIIVDVGETAEEVLAREGAVPVEGQRVGLIVRQIVEPHTVSGTAIDNVQPNGESEPIDMMEAHSEDTDNQ